MNVILLCGGKGERLRPLTLEIPKPMVLVKGLPILWYILKQLEKYNLSDIYLTVGYKSSVIKDYFAANFKNLSIKVIDNGDVDIIERVKSVTQIQPDEDVLILYGDTIADVNIDNLISFNEKEKTRSTITVWPLSTDFGVVEFNDKMEVTEFKEKPRLNKWINIGYFILRKESFKYLNEFDKFEDFLKFCGSSGILNAYKHEGHHLTVNSLVELDFVEKNIDKLFEI
jgi:glucose-1-phosphate cytidylyltransferase